MYLQTQFVEKNAYKIHSELKNILQKVLVTIIKGNVREKEQNTKTISFQTKCETEKLLQRVTSTETHLIKCIKPNDNIREFNEQFVMSQLKYAGIISLLKIQRKCSIKISFAQIHKMCPTTSDVRPYSFARNSPS